MSLIAGLLNAMVYVGSCIATYGMGAISDTAGWSTVLAMIFALVSAAKWKRFIQQ